MASRDFSLHDLNILVAEENQFDSATIQGILRSLGATKVVEARTALSALQILSANKMDIVLCDIRMPPYDGFSLAWAIRHNKDNENRATPIVLFAATTQQATIMKARDVGANMVIQKPLSPANLRDRLQWVMLNPRPFIEAPTYLGPDRRFKIGGHSAGAGRRRADRAMKVSEESGPMLAQSAIDDIFKSAAAR